VGVVKSTNNAQDQLLKEHLYEVLEYQNRWELNTFKGSIDLKLSS